VRGQPQPRMAFTAIRTLRHPRNINLLAVHDQMRKAICFCTAVVRTLRRRTVPENHFKSVIMTGIKKFPSNLHRIRSKS